MALSKRNLLKLFVTLVIFCAAAVIIFLALRASSGQSQRAYLTGGVMEVTVLMPGVVQNIAPSGAKVQAGDILLQMEAQDYAREVMGMEQKVKELSASVPARYSSVLAAYLGIPQSEDELAGLVEASSQEERKAKDALEAASAEQAAFSARVRALELRTAGSPQYKQKLDDLRAQEEQLQGAVQQAYALHEAAVATRAGYEKQYTRKTGWARTLNTAPKQIQGQLGQLREAFKRMYELERSLYDSVMQASQDGTVLFAYLKNGDSAQKGAPALYFAPQSKSGLWVTAYFKPKEARKLQTGQRCTVTMGSVTSPLRLEGRVGELQPQPVPEADGTIAVKILLPDVQAERLAGLDPKQNISVTPE